MTSADAAEITVVVTPDELTLLISATASFASDFGHDEADILRATQDLLAKLERLEKVDKAS